MKTLIKPNPPPPQEVRIGTNINIHLLETEIKNRLRYMFDSCDKLRQEYQNLYNPKLKSMLKASLNRLLSQEEIERVLSKY